MKALFLVSLITLCLTNSAEASLKKKRVHIESPQNLEMWCGEPHPRSRYDFPYLASIRNYRSKKNGSIYQVAMIYKSGRPVFKERVNKLIQGDSLVYLSRDEDFSLKIQGAEGINSDAGFKAVIHDRDGATLVANGHFPCHKQHS